MTIHEVAVDTGTFEIVVVGIVVVADTNDTAAGIDIVVAIGIAPAVVQHFAPIASFAFVAQTLLAGVMLLWGVKEITKITCRHLHRRSCLCACF